MWITEFQLKLTMLIEINFEPGHAVWTGRNGTFPTYGLSVCDMQYTRDTQRTVMLQPITSRELIGNCLIEFPISAVPELIAALQQAMSEAERRETA